MKSCVYRLFSLFLSILLISFFSSSCGGGKKNENHSTVPLENLGITSIIPNSGSVAGGVPGLLKGTGFASGSILTIDGNKVTNLAYVSSGELSFTLPPGNTGAKEVRVSNPDGQTAILSGGFKYIPEGIFVVMGFILPADDNISYAVKTGDLNGDGKQDIFMANDGINSLFFNKGDGRFENASPTNLPEGVGTADVTRDAALGDIDADGDIDIVIANDFERLSKIYINDGKGLFTAVLLPVRGCAKAVKLGDIDNDNDLDLLIVNFYSNDCPEITRLFINDGAGGFTDATATRLPNGLAGRYRSINGKFADLNNDGYLDILIANLAGSDLLYINDGNGVFKDLTGDLLPLAVADSTAIDTGDLDGDLDEDIVVFTLDKELLYINDGSGRFVLSTGNLPDNSDLTWDGKLVDIDKDGDLDIIKINNGQNLLYLNNGAGRFFDQTTGRMPLATAEGMGLETGDLNGDGQPDLIIANGKETGQQNRIYFGNGQGAYFDATGNLPIDTGMTKDIGVGDLDGDGALDMVLADYGGSIRLLTGDGKRNFTEEQGTPVPAFNNENRFEAVLLFDMDNDFDLDLMVITGDNQSDRLYRNDSSSGSILFSDVTAANFDSQIQTNATGAAVGDMDNDGDPDIIIAAIGRETVWINDGSGKFSDETDRRLPVEPEGNKSSGAVLLSDLNGDGYADIILSNNNSSGIDSNKQNRLYLNRGARGPGLFDDVTSTHLPAAIDDDTMEIAAADIDADGDLDLAIANDNFGNGCKNRLYLNKGDGHFIDVTIERLLSDCDGTRGVSFVDVDGDSDVDIFFVNRGQDRLYLNDATGTFIIDATTQNLPQEQDDGNKVKNADLDADGDLDIILAVSGQSKIYVNVNN